MTKINIGDFIFIRKPISLTKELIIFKEDELNYKILIMEY